MQKPLIYNQLVLETPKPEESRSQKVQKDKKELFLTLYGVYIKALALKEFCIFICGDTRTGKSTLHNCIVNPNNLVGKEKGLNNIYVLRDPQDLKLAKIGSQIISVTIMPNISLLNSSTTLVDLPGMKDRRDGIEVIKVNFINAKFFSTPRKAKFIVVFTQGALKDIDNGGFKDTLHNFLSFFNSQHFSFVEEKRQLFSSVAFIFTSVDFKGKKYKKVKQKYLSQLLVMLEKLQNWYQEKPSEMPSFPLAKQLIKTIVAQRRIQLFGLAVEESSPDYRQFLQSFDRHNWKYLNIRDKIDKIVFPYDKQYQALDETQRKLVDEIINWRFSLCLKMRNIIGQMLAKIINSLGQKTINIDSDIKDIEMLLNTLPNYPNIKDIEMLLKMLPNYPNIKDIEKLLKKLPNYSDVKDIEMQLKTLPNYSDIKDIEILLNTLPNYDLSLQQNQLEVPQECTIDQRLLCFIDLSEAGKRVNDYELWQKTNIMLPLSDYFTKHLKNMFELQINIIKRLLSFSNPALALIKRLQTDLNKMLTQAAIFSRLSPTFESRFKHKFADQLIFGNQVGSIKDIKQKFIEYFQFKPLKKQDYKSGDLKRIIKIFVGLKEEFKEMNPTIFYTISFNLKHILASIYRQNAMNSQFVEQSYSALIEAVKSHICLALLPLSSYERQLEQLVKQQRSILSQTEKVFRLEKNQNRINGVMQLRLAFENLIGSKHRDQFKSQVKRIIMILADFMKAQFRNINLTKQQMAPAITVSSYANNEAEIHAILSQYEAAMKSQINDEKVRIEAPITYSFPEEAQHYEQIRQKIKGKKVFFVLGENLCGKSTCIQIFKRKKMAYNKEGCFDLEKPSKFKTINHTNISNKYPNLSSLDQNDLFLEIPYFHNLEAHEKYLKMGFLSEMMKATNTFKIIWVVKENSFKSKSFENTISQIIKLLMDKKSKQPKESIITLAITHLTTEKGDMRNILENHIQSLTTVDKKVAKYLNWIKTKNQIICESVDRYQQMAICFQELRQVVPSFESSKLALTYGDLFNRLNPEPLKQHILSKIELVRNMLNPLKQLTFESLSKFLQGRQFSEKDSFYEQFEKILKRPIASGYDLNLSALPRYETTMGLTDNRPFIYHKAIQLRVYGLYFGSQYNFNATYQQYGRYMELFFSNMVYLCCSTENQYKCFMKLRRLVAILLKELEYFSLIFNCEKIDEKYQQLDGWLKFRDIMDIMPNFTEKSAEELMQILMREASRYRENQLRSYIELLFFFIKSKTAYTNITIAAMIELLIFMLRLRPNKKFVMDWDKDLTEKKLIEPIFNYPFVQKNSSKNLLAFGKLQQQASEKTLNELADLKKILIDCKID